VINGRYDRLRQYTSTLNEYFLLPSLVEADGLKETRDALKLEGADIEMEDDEDFVPVRIYALKSLM